MTICLDASITVKLIVLEPDSPKIRTWFANNAGYQLIAPSHMHVEVGSTIRQKIIRGLLTIEDATRAMGILTRLGIQPIEDMTLLPRALSLASDLGQATVYDTLYLALAERERCPLLTADKAFAKACSERFPFVRAL